MQYATNHFHFLGKHSIIIYLVVIQIFLMLASSDDFFVLGREAKPYHQFQAPAHSQPHDVALDPSRRGPVWYTAQGAGELGTLDPATGEKRHIPLGNHSAPNGIIIGPDLGLWITDDLLKAVVRVDQITEQIKLFPIPVNTTNSKLNAATFDKNGVLWFTDQSGYYGKLEPKMGKVDVFAAPNGPGPYGIATTPDGSVYFNSWNGNYTARINLENGKLTVLEPPSKDSMPRGIWSDSKGNLWISEWASGKLAKYSPDTNKWQEWKLPGDKPQPYAVYVDEYNKIWVSDFGIQNNTQSMLRFDPDNEKFKIIPLPSNHSDIRQITGRPGEIWGAQSGIDRLIAFPTGNRTW